MASRAGIMVALLAGVLCLHNIDRVGFSIVLDGIKHSLALTDTQLGLLAGPAFAFLNAGAAVPLARLADRWGRRNVLSACIVVWSALTVASGLAAGFVPLVLVRGGVGFADAAARPVSQAMISAFYPPARRALMLSLLVGGSYIGTVLGFSTAGAIAQHFGWRLTLVCLGLPGLVLGAVLWTVLPEPCESTSESAPEADGWWRVLREPDFCDAAMAIGSAQLLGWAAVVWLPSFLQRSYGMGPQETGFWLAVVIGLGSVIGVLFGGFVSNRFYVRSPRAGLWFGFWTTLASAPLLTLAFLTHSKFMTLALLLASGIVGAVCIAPVYARVQEIAAPPMRATVAAVLAVVNTLLGHAAGPALVGAISDFAEHRYGRESLRFSLMMVSLLGVWPAWHLWRLARRRKKDAERQTK